MRALLLCLCLLLNQQALSQDSFKVGIIIDDLGNNLTYGRELIRLPYQLTYSILPQRPYTERLAEYALEENKEVMVHLPMQSMRATDLGAGALTLDLTSKQFKHKVRQSIASVPHAKGVNNHMGSLLTQYPLHMSWLMDVLSEFNNDLYFVDSRTTKETVAAKIAKQHYIPHVNRDVFIDNIQDPQAIEKQLQRLTRLAREKGYAVAIGHPHPETIAALKEYLPTLSKQNIQITPITELINHQHAHEHSDKIILSENARYD